MRNMQFDILHVAAPSVVCLTPLPLASELVVGGSPEGIVEVLGLGPVQQLHNANTVLSSSVLQSFHPLLQDRQRQQAFLGKPPRRHANQQQVSSLVARLSKT